MPREKHANGKACQKRQRSATPVQLIVPEIPASVPPNDQIDPDEIEVELQKALLLQQQEQQLLQLIFTKKL